MLQTIVQMQSFLSNEKVIDPKWVGFFGHRVKYPTPLREPADRSLLVWFFLRLFAVSRTISDVKINTNACRVFKSGN